MSSTTSKQPLVWIGVVLSLVAVVGVAAAVRSLAWQLQTRLAYTPGTCRVLKAEVVPAGSSFELRVAHEVLIDGRGVGRSEYTEQDTPSYPTREEAEESLRNYAVGSEHPCWYYAPDPARSSILVDRSMDTATQTGVLIISLFLGAVGIKLLKWAMAPREKGRETRADVL